jgi:Fe-S-cluster-containing dehydrogenase component
MVVDVARCNGCYNCVIACKDEHWGNEWRPIAAAQPRHGAFWINLEKKERGKFPRVKVSYTPKLCMHCHGPPCGQAAKQNAVYTRPDGIVIIDPEKAVDRKELLTACPYEAIFWNDEKRLPQKCTFCAHLLDKGWNEPRCVQACPTHALVFGDSEDPNSEVSKILTTRTVEYLQPELKLKTNVYYVALPKSFVAGTVVFGDTDECAEDVKVTLEDTSEAKELSTRTNNYGDFEFENLIPKSRYRVRFEAVGYATASIDLEFEQDRHLGQITLKRK